MCIYNPPPPPQDSYVYEFVSGRGKVRISLVNSSYDNAAL